MNKLIIYRMAVSFSLNVTVGILAGFTFSCIRQARITGNYVDVIIVGAGLVMLIVGTIFWYRFLSEVDSFLRSIQEHLREKESKQ